MSKAIEHVDQTLAGKVSVIRNYEPSTANSWGSKSNGTRTWEKGSSRGARGGYKGEARLRAVAAVPAALAAKSLHRHHRLRSILVLLTGSRIKYIKVMSFLFLF